MAKTYLVSFAIVAVLMLTLRSPIDSLLVLMPILLAASITIAVGMVIERVRKPAELDHLRWYCEGCGEVLHDASFQLEDLGSQLKPIIEGFFSDETLRTCKKCGEVMQVPGG